METHCRAAHSQHMPIERSISLRDTRRDHGNTSSRKWASDHSHPLTPASCTFYIRPVTLQCGAKLLVWRRWIVESLDKCVTIGVRENEGRDLYRFLNTATVGTTVMTDSSPNTVDGTTAVLMVVGIPGPPNRRMGVASRIVAYSAYITTEIAPDHWSVAPSSSRTPGSSHKGVTTRYFIAFAAHRASSTGGWQPSESKE